MKKYSLGVFWMRRDLRIEDNKALSEALNDCDKVVVIFVFDTLILNKLKNKEDRRVTFIHESLREVDDQLGQLDSRLIINLGEPLKIIPDLIKKLKAQALYFNEDYEPYAIKRDQAIKDILGKSKINVHHFKDQVIFSPLEVVKNNNEPYQVFTPYMKAWLLKLSKKDYLSLKSQKNYYNKSLLKDFPKNPTLEDIGFKSTPFHFKFQNSGRKVGLSSLNYFKKHINKYKESRDFPSFDNGTSGLSVHLRFGTLSIRECVRASLESNTLGSKTWLSELIWREFYQMILSKNPYVINSAYKKKYNQIKWPNNTQYFDKWSKGETGYPIVDAGMRQLNQTGWMHNRVRMITASFLIKDLLVDWKKGEEYFAEKLLDFDLASNNGGWQWCASTGCDAQPYFRIFNPSLQSERFDVDATYIKHWIPELKNCPPKEIHFPHKSQLDQKYKYPKPLIIHADQKDLALDLFKKVSDV